MVVACPGIKADADRERTLGCVTKGGPGDVVSGGVAIRRLEPAVHGVRGPEHGGDAIQGVGSEGLTSTPLGGVVRSNGARGPPVDEREIVVRRPEDLVGGLLIRLVDHPGVEEVDLECGVERRRKGEVRAVGASGVVVSKVLADGPGLKCGVGGSRHRDGSDAEGTRVRADSRVRVES